MTGDGGGGIDAPLAPGKFTSFGFPKSLNTLPHDLRGTFTGADHQTVSVVGFQLDRSMLTPSFEITPRTKAVMVGMHDETAAPMPHDFRSPVTYTVIADDDTSTEYTVGVTSRGFVVGVAMPAAGIDHLVTADLDGDPFPDLVSSSSSGGKVVAWFNHSTLATFDGVTFAPPLPPTSVTVSDVTGDTKPDLISIGVNGTGAATVYAFANAQPSDTFSTTPMVVPYGMGGATVATADLDGDGLADFVALDPSNYKLQLAINKTTTTGQVDIGIPTIIMTGALPQAVAFGAFDNTPGLDIVVANHNVDTVSLFGNRTALGGNQAILTSSTESNVCAGPHALVVADMDGDGHDDVVVACSNDNSMVLRSFAVLHSQQGTFSTKLWETSYPTTGVAVLDLDGDGAIDVVAAAATPAGEMSDLEPLVNAADGMGTLVHSATIAESAATELKPSNIVTADFNHDGMPDLAVSSPTGIEVYLMVAMVPQ